MTTNRAASVYHSMEDMFCYWTLRQTNADLHEGHFGELTQRTARIFPNQYPGLECSTDFWNDFQCHVEKAQADGSPSLELIEFEYEGRYGPWSGLDEKKRLMEAHRRLGAELDMVYVRRTADGFFSSRPSYTPAVSGLLSTTWETMRPHWCAFLDRDWQTKVDWTIEKIAGAYRRALSIDLSKTPLVAGSFREPATGTSLF